jgi:hypothetical protein
MAGNVGIRWAGSIYWWIEGAYKQRCTGRASKVFASFDSRSACNSMRHFKCPLAAALTPRTVQVENMGRAVQAIMWSSASLQNVSGPIVHWDSGCQGCAAVGTSSTIALTLFDRY